jgi:hypothetical protein
MPNLDTLIFTESYKIVDTNFHNVKLATKPVLPPGLYTIEVPVIISEEIVLCPVECIYGTFVFVKNPLPNIAIVGGYATIKVYEGEGEPTYEEELAYLAASINEGKSDEMIQLMSRESKLKKASVLPFNHIVKRVIELSALGSTEAGIADALGISRANWKNNKDRIGVFHQAYYTGRDIFNRKTLKKHEELLGSENEMVAQKELDRRFRFLTRDDWSDAKDTSSKIAITDESPRKDSFTLDALVSHLASAPLTIENGS